MKQSSIKPRVDKLTDRRTALTKVLAAVQAELRYLRDLCDHPEMNNYNYCITCGKDFNND